jgi:hypothetical protein
VSPLAKAKSEVTEAVVLVRSAFSGTLLRMDFATIADDLNETVRAALPMLHGVTNTEASLSAAPGKWSKKEILAHLIDSASNNHQRFVRAAMQESLEFPGYEQDRCIAVQKPNLMSWEMLIDLWSAYNWYLAHVLNQLPTSSSEASCRIGAHAPVTLVWLANDYVEHLKHHLNQIVGKKFATAWTAWSAKA